MRVVEPAFAIAIPRNPQATEYAVDKSSLALPAWFEPEDYVRTRTDEGTAHTLAQNVIGRAQGVDYKHLSPAGQTLYVMKPIIGSQELTDNYRWLDISKEAVRSAVCEVLDTSPADPRFAELQKLMAQTVHLMTLIDGLKGSRQNEALMSYFWENPGMYNLPQMP